MPDPSPDARLYDPGPHGSLPAPEAAAVREAADELFRRIREQYAADVVREEPSE